MAELGEANIGGRMVPAWLLNLTAEELDSLKSRWYSNPNLLDNWYFGNPINQRGVTSGTAGWNEYFLDRWRGYCIYDITKGYLEVGSGSYLVQRIENGDSIPYPVTFSILFQDGTFGYQTVYADGGFSLIGENIKGFADSQIHGENPYISYNNNSGSTVGIIAVKLELGTVQTLAHQDADGNWVLNEIPDCGEQLRQCQRYFQKHESISFVLSNAVQGDSYRTNSISFPTMRTIPTVSIGTSQTGTVGIIEGVRFMMDGEVRTYLVDRNALSMAVPQTVSSDVAGKSMSLDKIYLDANL